MTNAKRNRVKRWIAALRSGKYTQGSGQLLEIDPTDDGQIGEQSFCCLGVCTDLYAAEHRSKDWSWSAIERDLKLYTHDGYYDGGPMIVEYDREDSHLTRPVAKWLGLASVQGEFDGSGASDDPDEYVPYCSLADMNDGGASFEYIADFIEGELEGRTKCGLFE